MAIEIPTICRWVSHPSTLIFNIFIRYLPASHVLLPKGILIVGLWLLVGPKLETNIGRFHTWGYPSFIHFRLGFPVINHTFSGTPICGNPHICGGIKLGIRWGYRWDNIGAIFRLQVSQIQLSRTRIIIKAGFQPNQPSTKTDLTRFNHQQWGFSHNQNVWDFLTNMGIACKKQQTMGPTLLKMKSGQNSYSP